jgi:predicted permease
MHRRYSMQNFVQDLRYGIRMLLQSPGFSVAAVVCLALGIGATTAIFSIVYAVLLRPLPYSQPQKLVRVYTEFPNFPNGGLRRFWTSPPEFLDLRRYTHSWQSLDGWTNGGANIDGGKEPSRVTTSFVSGGLLEALGVQPIQGRLLNPHDDENGAPLTAVISYGLWQRAFGGESAAVGKEIHLNGKKCTVVGIMPKGFQFPPGEADPPEVWSPLQIDPAKPGGRGSHFLYLLGRLKPDVSIDQARQEAAQLVSHSEATTAQNNHPFTTKNHPLVMFPFQDEVVSGVRLAMLTLLGAVVFVLLIACVNVANLLLARAEARQREIAIRKALGADLGRLVRQFVTEGVVLALAGAIVGCLLAEVGLRVITRTNAGSIPRAAEISLNWPVLLFTLLLSFATGIAFGLAPLAQIVARNVHETLKAAAARTTATVAANNFRRALVIGELALALVLLIGTGLMIRAFWNLQQVSIGMDASNLLTMRIALPRGVYPENDRVTQFWTTLQERVATLPGVVGVTFLEGLPPARPVDANDTMIEGFVPREKGPIQNIDYYQAAGDRFFETMGIRLIEGRFLDRRDGANAPQTLVVNQTLAHVYWPGESAIGHRMKPGGGKEWSTVVGVVADVKNAGIDKPTGTELFIPYRQAQGFGIRNSYLVVRTKGDPESLVTPVRREVNAIDPSLPVSSVRTMEDVMGAAQSRPRFLALLLTMFASVALVLAAVGLYGVISYSVAQRTSEFGIRMALGAAPSNVLGMVVGQGLRLGLVGIAVGALGAIALTRLMRGLLFGVSAFDPLTFLGMAALLGGVMLAACYVPARRATRVDPMVALRYE